MATLPFEIGQMHKKSNTRKQLLDAVKQLDGVLKERYSGIHHPYGFAYIISNNWQSRFEKSFRAEIPDWKGLAGFRCITDFSTSYSVLEKILPLPANTWEKLLGKVRKILSPKFKNEFTYKEFINKADKYCTGTTDFRLIDTAVKFWCAFYRYFEKKENINSGKLTIAGTVEDFLIEHFDKFDPLLGGQAGNILWLWHCIGTNPIAYSPYFFKRFGELPDRINSLADLRILQIQNGTISSSNLGSIKNQTGIQAENGRINAPSGGSVVTAQKGRRLIFMFQGNRELEKDPTGYKQWDTVEFIYEKKTIAKLERTSELGTVWPGLGFFCETFIDNKKFVVNLLGKEELEKLVQIQNKPTYAVIGGIDSIFKDSWFKKDIALRNRFLSIAESQLRILASCGIRIGIELSGIPVQEYADFIQRMCQEGIVIALGINGEDELPDVVGQASLGNKFQEFWLDPKTVNPVFEDELTPKNGSYIQGKHIEYITWLRAKKLADASGVRTLYVHTNGLDFILRKGADPGALFHAQQMDMLGKGLVIAALMQRAYRNDWLSELKGMTPAVSPDAMKSLGIFADHFYQYEEVCGNKEDVREQLLQNGYWIAPNDQYSLAVVPVMWPYISEQEAGKGLPEKLNTTGAGDMTFGAFFLLSGV